jgi:hypothetical protein
MGWRIRPQPGAELFTPKKRTPGVYRKRLMVE